MPEVWEKDMLMYFVLKPINQGRKFTANSQTTSIKKKRCMFPSRNTSCLTAHSATLQQHVNQLMDFSLQLSFFYPTYPIVIPVSLSPLYIIPACIIAYTK